MKNLRAWLRSYFAFSQTETRGALLLILVTLIALSAASLLSARFSKVSPVSTQDWYRLDSLVAVIDSREATGSTAVHLHSVTELFPFDPNVADSATLTQLGLKPWIAQRVVNYRQKGGAFRIKTDFKKIYGLSETAYHRLYPYLQLPEKLAVRKRKEATRGVPRLSNTAASSARAESKKRTLSLDINAADTTQLKQLRGIGSRLAARIVKYRQALGGYRTKEQLQEIYHLTESGAVSLQKNTYIASGDQVRRLNINRADAKILAQHPYISWDLARALVQHRQDYGEFHSLDDLREVYLMTEKVFEKITPYLEI